MGIRESGEMYLETIYMLSMDGKNVRSVDISEQMGYSKPSISRAVGLLKGDVRQLPAHPRPGDLIFFLSLCQRRLNRALNLRTSQDAAGGGLGVLVGIPRPASRCRPIHVN